jgi:hypothetical protein
LRCRRSSESTSTFVQLLPQAKSSPPAWTEIEIDGK